MTDVTNPPNFYVGRSADVGDMLLHGQIISECKRLDVLPARKTEHQCLLCEWKMGEGLGQSFVRDNEQILCFIVIQLEFV